MGMEIMIMIKSKIKKKRPFGLSGGNILVLLTFSARRFPRRIRLLLGVELQAAAVKVDGDLEVFPIAEAAGVFLTVWIFEFSPSLMALVMR